ncbi:MAG: hypothetical protein LUM44_17885 [Pyrinomonadaceae bacterium]|nr:hypothetical protein [Pyrinomonadaceae bacterium]
MANELTQAENKSHVYSSVVDDVIRNIEKHNQMTVTDISIIEGDYSEFCKVNVKISVTHKSRKKDQPTS